VRSSTSPSDPTSHRAPQDVEELIVGDGDRSHGALDAASVEVESLRVCDGDFLVLGPYTVVRGDIWLGAKRCNLSADRCGSGNENREGLRWSDVLEAEAGRKTLSSTFRMGHRDFWTGLGAHSDP
jgi:hypothetical protein